jgi:hypothetical protein
MALSNAERQRRFRQQRKGKADSLDLKHTWYDLDRKPQDYARLTFALMLALMQHGSAEADSGEDDTLTVRVRAELMQHGSAEADSGEDDTLTVRVRADLGDLPQDVEVALRFAMREWLSEATRALWKRHGNIDFQIRIEAVTDKRKRAAMKRKLAAEEE